MEAAALQELAKILVVAAAALRNLVGQTSAPTALIAESLDKVLEIADALEHVGQTLNLKAAN